MFSDLNLLEPLALFHHLPALLLKKNKEREKSKQKERNAPALEAPLNGTRCCGGHTTTTTRLPYKVMRELQVYCAFLMVSDRETCS